VSPARPESGHVPSAQAASILIDLLGVETFADEAVAYVKEQMSAPLTSDHVLLIKLGAAKGAALVADEVRKFAQRP
jgi:hypothetical protein